MEAGGGVQAGMERHEADATAAENAQREFN